MYAWGAGEYGQLGNNSRYDRSSPERVKFSEDLKVQKLDAGKNHSVILTDQGFLYCFGEDNLGQLGLQRRNKIVEVPTLVSYMTHKSVINVSCGTFHTVILIEPYYVFSTGNNKFGQLGLGETTDTSIFTFVRKLSHKNVIDIFAGDHHSWFILDHDDPFIDDYEIPEPWRFSERSISDDNDFKEGRVRKKKRKREGQAQANQFEEEGQRMFPDDPSGKKKRRKNRELDLDFDEADPGNKRKRNKMNYFDDQDKAGEDPYEAADLEDEEDWEEEPSDGEKLFDDNEIEDMGQKNFYPSKKNYDRQSKENSRMEDSLGMPGSKRNNSKKSLNMNMFANPDPKVPEYSMKPNMLGGQKQSHLDIPSSSRMMRGTDSQEAQSFSQNNSMRMDSRKKIQMKPNSGLNMMGQRGGEYEMGVISSGNHREIPEEGPGKDDSELISDKGSLMDSLEDQNDLEYDSKQVYPNPNSSSNIKKRRTVDNPLAIENDLVNTYSMMNKQNTKDPIGKRHQSQAEKRRKNQFSQNEIDDLEESMDGSESQLSVPDEDIEEFGDAQGGLNSAGPFQYQNTNIKEKKPDKNPQRRQPGGLEEESYSEDIDEQENKAKKRRKKKKKRINLDDDDDEESEDDSQRRKKRKRRRDDDEDDDPRRRRNRGHENDLDDRDKRRRYPDDDDGRGRDNAGHWNQNQYNAGNVPEGGMMQPRQDTGNSRQNPNDQEGRYMHDQKVVYNTYNTYNTYNVDGNRRYDGPGGVARQNDREGFIPQQNNNDRENRNFDGNNNDEDDLMDSKSRDRNLQNDTNMGRVGENDEDSQSNDFSSEKEMQDRGNTGDKKSYTDLGRKGNARERDQRKTESIGDNINMRENIQRVNLQEHDDRDKYEIEDNQEDFDLDQSLDEDEGFGDNGQHQQPPASGTQGNYNNMRPPTTQPPFHGGNQNEFGFPENQDSEQPDNYGGRQYSTGLNIIKEEEDYPSSAQTNPRQSRQKMFDDNSVRKETKKIHKNRTKNPNDNGRQQNMRNVKVRREERIEQIGEPQSELVFQVMDEHVERERVEVRRRRVLTCASRVVLTDNKRSHRFVVMRILKSDNPKIKERIAQYIDLLSEADPGMEYYNVTDFDNVYRQADHLNLERVEDLGDYTSLTLMMIHNMAEYGGLVGGDIRQVAEEYRQIRSQLTTIGEMYIFTDEEIGTNRKWGQLTQWVHLFKEMFNNDIHGMSVLELRPKEFK